MGLAKNRAIEEDGDRERRWQAAAEINNYRCENCTEIPPYEEREVYFETHHCARCLHALEKLEKE
jgi:hypothetical protein